MFFCTLLLTNLWRIGSIKPNKKYLNETSMRKLSHKKMIMAWMFPAYSADKHVTIKKQIINK
jgi:hypothetical protein